MATEYVRVVARRQSGCFCAVPALPIGEPVPYRPRFNFRRAVQDYARTHGIENLQFHPRMKVATGEWVRPCDHRQAQAIGFGWELVYGQPTADARLADWE